MDLHSKKLSVSILNSATRRKLQFSHKPEDKEVSFKNTKKQLQIPFIIYADFEAYTTKINEPHHENTTMYKRHMPLGFGYMVVSTDPHYTKPPVIYGGDDVVDIFLQRLDDEQREITNILSVEKLMVMTAEDVHRHQQATECFICG